MAPKYIYRWSVNLSINPIHWLLLVIWVGDQNWKWCLRQPLKIKRAELV